ncbi:MAG: succinate dehydrogenase, hydrophobic membrane anchor protein [Alphaproteobacteria bacterium]|nr:succinate dehydrogenase, hydrophobic membrane anchor protein [Alphaproteobacteria bacterium]MCY4495992.1 succinate dehydrogenase, hydrophobic membrane anchor protein [Rhodospirillaceae bacterium]
MSHRTPAGRVHGLGSAQHGVDHWWAQRLTALALIPLIIWFCISIIGLIGTDHVTFTSWLSMPGRAVAMLLLVIATFYHMKLGLQVVIEDYVHERGWNVMLLVLNNFACVSLGTACAFAVIKVAVMG